MAVIKMDRIAKALFAKYAANIAQLNERSLYSHTELTPDFDFINSYQTKVYETETNFLKVFAQSDTWMRFDCENLIFVVENHKDIKSFEFGPWCGFIVTLSDETALACRAYHSNSFHSANVEDFESGIRKIFSDIRFETIKSWYLDSELV